MNKTLIIMSGLLILGGCSSNSSQTDNQVSDANQDSQQEVSNSDTTISDNLFIESALAKEITTADCTLADGSTTSCDTITIAGYPADGEVGPFCPPTTSTTADQAGIWLDGENLYDADGEFITQLATIYDDENWKLYNDDGTVNITDSLEAFEAAARPNVDEAYQNHCVEGRLEWLEGGQPIETTVEVPSEPTVTDTATPVGGKVGVTLNGVVIDPAAPVSAILGAYTIAAFDDCGGHFNPVEGYHYHAATGCSEVGEVPEGETKPFAIAMDGFMIHSPYPEREEPADLDECNGHETDELGYHYHANPAAENAVLTCFKGSLEESSASSRGRGQGGPPTGERPEGGPPQG